MHINKGDAIPGMAYFRATGPRDKTCRTCKYFAPMSGVLRQMQREKTTQVPPSAAGRCEKWRQMMVQTQGGALPSLQSTPVFVCHHAACKYYEPK